MGLVGMMLTLGASSIAAANPPEAPGSVFAAARAAVADGRVVKSPLLGFSIVKTAFHDAPPQGALLIGFEVGLGKVHKNADVIYALRPLYRTADGELVTQDYGLFRESAARTPRQGLRHHQVVRTARIKAPPGYAVGGISVRTALYLRGLSVTFMRVRGQALDPADVLVSDWVGDRGRGRKMSAHGQGTAVVGIFGNRDDRRVLAVGLIYLRAPEPPARQDNQLPHPQPRPEKPRAEPPAPRAPEPPPFVPQAERPPADNPFPPNDRDDSTDEPPPAPRNWGWLLLVVFACVSLPAFIGLLVYFGRHRHLADVRRPSDQPAPRTAALPAPAESTAICAEPPPARASSLCAGPHPGLNSRSFEVGVPRLEERMQSFGRSGPVFFVARTPLQNGCRRLYRVYLLAEELLVLETELQQPPPNFTGVAVAHGLIGGLIAGLANAVVAFLRTRSADARRRQLDNAGLDELIRLAETEKDSFRAGPADVVCARLDPPSDWERGPKEEYPGRLYLRHRVCGEISLEFLTSVEMRIAEEELPRIFGDRLAVNIIWDPQLMRYVRKP
jgi:hypothetical protein